MSCSVCHSCRHYTAFYQFLRCTRVEKCFHTSTVNMTCVLDSLLLKIWSLRNGIASQVNVNFMTCTSQWAMSFFFFFLFFSARNSIETDQSCGHLYWSPLASRNPLLAASIKYELTDRNNNSIVVLLWMWLFNVFSDWSNQSLETCPCWTLVIWNVFYF